MRSEHRARFHKAVEYDGDTQTPYPAMLVEKPGQRTTHGTIIINFPSRSTHGHMRMLLAIANVYLCATGYGRRRDTSVECWLSSLIKLCRLHFQVERVPLAT